MGPHGISYLSLDIHRIWQNCTQTSLNAFVRMIEDRIAVEQTYVENLKKWTSRYQNTETDLRNHFMYPELASLVVLLTDEAEMKSLQQQALIDKIAFGSKSPLKLFKALSKKWSNFGKFQNEKVSTLLKEHRDNLVDYQKALDEVNSAREKVTKKCKHMNNYKISVAKQSERCRNKPQFKGIMKRISTKTENYEKSLFTCQKRYDCCVCEEQQHRHFILESDKKLREEFVLLERERLNSMIDYLLEYVDILHNSHTSVDCEDQDFYDKIVTKCEIVNVRQMIENWLQTNSKYLSFPKSLGREAVSSDLKNVNVSASRDNSCSSKHQMNHQQVPDYSLKMARNITSPEQTEIVELTEIKEQHVIPCLQHAKSENFVADLCENDPEHLEVIEIGTADSICSRHHFQNDLDFLLKNSSKDRKIKQAWEIVQRVSDCLSESTAVVHQVSRDSTLLDAFHYEDFESDIESN